MKRILENQMFYGASLLIDFIASCAIISSWQQFGNRKSASQNKLCN